MDAKNAEGIREGTIGRVGRVGPVGLFGQVGQIQHIRHIRHIREEVAKREKCPAGGADPERDNA